MDYEEQAKNQLKKWQYKLRSTPSILYQKTKSAQECFNGLLPKKYHQMMTLAIKNMTKMVLLGATYTTHEPLENRSLEEREHLVKEKSKRYQTTAVLEGAGTGAGGFILAAADFPLLLSIKIKLLYEIAACYGFDTKDYRERLYILHIFQLAFSDPDRTHQLLTKMSHWDQYVETLPTDLNDFNWFAFQKQYRDYIDLAKLLQMLPGVGALVGAFANHRLMDKLTTTAIFAYRLRLFPQ